MKKNKRYGSQYLVAAGISLLLLTAVFQLSARTLPGFGTWYAHHIYSWIVKSVGRLTGLLPFSVVEMGLYGLLCLLFLDVVRLSAAANPCRNTAKTPDSHWQAVAFDRRCAAVFIHRQLRHQLLCLLCFPHMPVWRMALTPWKSWRPCAVIWWSWSMNPQKPVGSLTGSIAVPGGWKR